jgi:hypothetical protein
MAGIAFRTITQDDLKEETLANLNALLLDIVNEINRLSGVSGTIQLHADLDLQGHRILNSPSIPRSSSGG